MFSKLSYRQKNKLLLILAGLLLLLSWFLAFSKTVAQISLNRQLQRQVDPAEDITFNPTHSRQKLQALNSILKTYQVQKGDWSNQLWIKASVLAMKEQAGIDYRIANLDEMDAQDSTHFAEKEKLQCYGSYRQLLKLIDALEKTKGIGRIAALQINAPQEDQGTEKSRQCVLQLEFKGITH